MNQTGRSPPDGAGERTSDEIDAAHALQGMKRKGDENSGDVTPDKRIKMETDDDVIDPNSYQPTRIILSTEAFFLFQGKEASSFLHFPKKLRVGLQSQSVRALSDPDG